VHEVGKTLKEKLVCLAGSVNRAPDRFMQLIKFTPFLFKPRCVHMDKYLTKKCCYASFFEGGGGILNFKLMSFLGFFRNAPKTKSNRKIIM